MTGDNVTIVENLPKPKRQRKIINRPLQRKNSIAPWKPAQSSEPPALTRQQSLTQMVPGLRPPQIMVVDSEEDEDDIIDEPAPKRQRLLTPATSENSADGSAATSGKKSKPRRKSRSNVESQADYRPPASKVKKPKDGQKQKGKKAAPRAKKQKNTLTQACYFIRSDPSACHSEEDVPQPAKRRGRKVGANSDRTPLKDQNETPRKPSHSPEVPNSSSQTRAGDDPYHPYGGAAGESQNGLNMLATPRKKIEGKYADVEEMPNSQPTPTLTPIQEARLPLHPKSGNVRFASPLVWKSQDIEAVAADIDLTPRPKMKSLSPIKQSPTPRPAKQLSQMPVVDDSTDDEVEDHETLEPPAPEMQPPQAVLKTIHAGEPSLPLNLNGTNVYEDLSESQWQAATELTYVAASDTAEPKFGTPLTLEQELERAKQCKSQGDQFLHIQHLERRLKEKRRPNEVHGAAPGPSSRADVVNIIEDSDLDELDSDLDEVYEDAMEGDQDADYNDNEAYEQGNDYDREPKTFNPLDDALDRDASRFFMTQMGTQRHDMATDEGVRSQDSQGEEEGANEARIENAAPRIETQIKEESVDRIPSTPQDESHEPVEVVHSPEQAGGLIYTDDGDIENGENGLMFSTAAEVRQVVIPSSQEKQRAASVHEELVLEVDKEGLVEDAREESIARVDTLDRIQSTPPATARLRPSQISTVLPTQASQARLAAELAEDEEEEQPVVIEVASSEHSSSPEFTHGVHGSSPHIQHHESAPTSPPSHVRQGSPIDLLKDLDWYKMPPPRLDSDEDHDPAALPSFASQKTPSQHQKSTSTIASSPLVGPPGYSQVDWTRKSNWSQTQMTNAVDYSLPPPPPLSSARDSNDSQ